MAFAYHDVYEYEEPKFTTSQLDQDQTETSQIEHNIANTKNRPLAAGHAIKRGHRSITICEAFNVVDLDISLDTIFSIVGVVCEIESPRVTDENEPVDELHVATSNIFVLHDGTGACKIEIPAKLDEEHYVVPARQKIVQYGAIVRVVCAFTELKAINAKSALICFGVFTATPIEYLLDFPLSSISHITGASVCVPVPPNGTVGEPSRVLNTVQQTEGTNANELKEKGGPAIELSIFHEHEYLSTVEDRLQQFVLEVLLQDRRKNKGTGRYLGMRTAEIYNKLRGLGNEDEIDAALLYLEKEVWHTYSLSDGASTLHTILAPE